VERSDRLLSVDGAVEEPYVLDWATLIDGPQTDWTGDIHCVTRWSKFGMHCRGMLVADVVERAARGMRSVTASEDYAACTRRREVRREDAYCEALRRRDPPPSDQRDAIMRSRNVRNSGSRDLSLDAPFHEERRHPAHLRFATAAVAAGPKTWYRRDPRNPRPTGESCPRVSTRIVTAALPGRCERPRRAIRVPATVEEKQCRARCSGRSRLAQVAEAVA
jgi:hypothetical protein